MSDLDDEENPYRSLLEVWLLHEMIFHWNELGSIAEGLVEHVMFRTPVTRSVFRSVVLWKGDYKKTMHSILDDYAPSVAHLFFAKLAVIKKTPKMESRDDWTIELDVDAALGALERDDVTEIIHLCWRYGLTDVGMPEWF